MSPAVAGAIRAEHSCACGAQPGERCRSYLTGLPHDHVHADRLYRSLFSRPNSKGTHP